MFPILSICLAIRNGLMAKVKGQSSILFALATIAAILFFMVIGGMFVAVTFCGSSLNLIALSSLNTQLRLQAAHELQQALTGTPLHTITIQLIAIGGYLVIRRAIEQEMDSKINLANKQGKN